MNTTYEQICFINPQQKRDERRNTLRLRERLLTEHGFETFEKLIYCHDSNDEAACVQDVAANDEYHQKRCHDQSREYSCFH